MSTAYHTPIAADAPALPSSFNGPLGQLDAAIGAVNAYIAGSTPFTAVDINGGTIDATVIGGATPAAGSFTGVTVVTAAADNNLVLNANAGQFRSFIWQSAGAYRWALSVTSAAESGADAGSNIQLIRYGDGGTPAAVMDISRSSGAMTLANDLSVGGALTITGALDHNGATYGLCGVEPSAPQTGYATFTNLTIDRTCDANASSTAELADILGTLIVDLKAKGVITD